MARSGCDAQEGQKDWEMAISEWHVRDAWDTYLLGALPPFPPRELSADMVGQNLANSVQPAVDGFVLVAGSRLDQEMRRGSVRPAFGGETIVLVPAPIPLFPRSAFRDLLSNSNSNPFLFFWRVLTKGHHGKIDGKAVDWALGLYSSATTSGR